MTTQSLGQVAPELLLDFATGAVSEPVALALATHASLNNEAAADLARLNQVGGALLETEMGSDINESALDALLDRLDDEPALVARPAFDDETKAIIPEPLRGYLPSSLKDLNWRRSTAGVEEADLLVPHGQDNAADGADYRVALLRIEPGREVPQHTHRGQELTVVLDGSYCDAENCFRRGDIEIADGDTDHAPLADAVTGCLCLIVMDAPLKLTGPIGRWLNPFIKY
ncbi:MAG: ChrR family anti-sigma-E factor [Pseudomonadota bacterium]